MRVLQRDKSGAVREMYSGEAGFQIGRSDECAVRLDSKLVADAHAAVDRCAEGWELRVLPGAATVEVEGREVAAGQRKALGQRAVLRIWQFELELIDDGEVRVAGRSVEQELTLLQRDLHQGVISDLDLRSSEYADLRPTPARLTDLNLRIDERLNGAFADRLARPAVREALLRMALRRLAAEALDETVGQPRDARLAYAAMGTDATEDRAASRAVAELLKRVGVNLSSKPEAGPRSAGKVEAWLRDAEAKLAEGFDTAYGAVAGKLPPRLVNYLVQRSLKKQLCDTIFGLGPLEDLLTSPRVSEVMMVHPGLIYVERNGRLMRHPETFSSDQAAMSVLERIVSPLGRRIDRSTPLVDGRLSDGSRVNAVIPPLAVRGPCLTIRRFLDQSLSIEKLVQSGALSPLSVTLLRACVLGRKNLIVAGGTGSGKTTLLNLLSGMIGDEERMVTIEDSAELRLRQEHVVTLEARPENVEGKGAYSIRDLVRNALRMRPDRVIVGECRGAEAIDMLQAMNTGHDGSMTTLHANSSADVIARLETMILLGADMPLTAVRRQIADAVDLIVFTRRLASGRRRVTQISEVRPVDPVTGEVPVLDVLALGERGGEGHEEYGDDAALEPTGHLPSFMPELVGAGVLDLAGWLSGGAGPEADTAEGGANG
ncbi:MAG: ATPase, T2SS/T4P/T4SS family [Planctomycetota bacterium]